MSETASLNLAQIFSNRSYEIPYYQRNYSWTEKNIKDLVSDIDFCLEEETKHYLGNIVLNERDTDGSITTFEIIDGQQRITTLTLILSNIYWFSERDLEPKLQTSDSKNMLSRLQSDCKSIFLERRDGPFTEENLRLKTADQQKDTYKEIILNRPEQRDCNPEKVSERNLKNVSDQIWDWISSKEKSSAEETVNYLHKLVNTITGDVSITEYKTEGSREAGRIFGVLNDRGKDLTIADKVKSTLIYRAATTQDDPEGLIKYIHEIFSEVYENVVLGEDQSEINNFMTSHWYMFSGPDESSLDDLHRLIEKEKAHLNVEGKTAEEQKVWMKNYIESLQEASEAYNKIRTDASSSNNTINSIRYFFNEIASADFMSLQLAIEICLKESEKEKALKNLEKISITAHEVGRRGSNTFARGKTQSFGYRLYSVYNNTTNSRTSAPNIFHTQKGEYSEYSGVGDVLRELDEAAEEIYSEDTLVDEIESYLGESTSVLAGKTDVPGWGGVRKDVMKYILYRLDENEDINLWDNGRDSLELEHMRPESKEADDSSNLVHCLGNLCVLERHLNNSCRDKPFNKKAPYYKKSKLDMPKKIVKQNTQNWTDEDIEERREQLAGEIKDKFTE